MLKSSAVAASDHCRRAGPDGEAADVLRFPESTAAGERASARVGKLEPEGGRVRVLARGDAAGRGEGGGGRSRRAPLRGHGDFRAGRRGRGPREVAAAGMS